MLSVIVAQNRPGGIDVLTSTLREQTEQDFELITCDELFPKYRAENPQVGKGSWRMAPGGERWCNYMRSLNRAVIVVVSPMAGLLAETVGYRPALGAAAAIFIASALMLTLSPFRRARVE